MDKRLADRMRAVMAHDKSPEVAEPGHAALHFNCCRSFNSARTVRQMRSQTPCSSQPRSRLPHVDVDGNSLVEPCQRTTLRKIHKASSSTLRLGARNRPLRRCRGGRGSKGSIFLPRASVSKGAYRRIRPPPGGLLHSQGRTTNVKSIYCIRF